jgi:hypothetical protein
MSASASKLLWLKCDSTDCIPEPILRLEREGGIAARYFCGRMDEDVVWKSM